MAHEVRLQREVGLQCEVDDGARAGAAAGGGWVSREVDDGAEAEHERAAADGSHRDSLGLAGVGGAGRWPRARRCMCVSDSNRSLRCCSWAA